MTAKSWLKFIALSLIWGTSFYWIKIGLREVGPVTLVFFRAGFATLGLILFILLARRRFPLKVWKLYLFLGFFNVALPFILITWSEKHITSGMASILNSTMPLTTALFAALFIKEERLTLQRIIGLAVGFGGVLVLMSDQIKEGLSSPGLGILAMLLAVLSYGGSAVFARLHNRGVTPDSQALGQMSFSLLFILPTMLTLEAPFVLPSQPFTYAALGWLGLLGSFVASIIWYSLMNDIGPSRLSMTTYTLPLIAVVLGAIALGEDINWRLLLGGLLIIFGIIIVNYKKNRSKTLSVEMKEEG